MQYDWKQLIPDEDTCFRMNLPKALFLYSKSRPPTQSWIMEEDIDAFLQVRRGIHHLDPTGVNFFRGPLCIYPEYCPQATAVNDKEHGFHHVGGKSLEKIDRNSERMWGVCGRRRMPILTMRALFNSVSASREQ